MYSAPMFSTQEEVTSSPRFRRASAFPSRYVLTASARSAFRGSVYPFGYYRFLLPPTGLDPLAFAGDFQSQKLNSAATSSDETFFKGGDPYRRFLLSAASLPWKNGYLSTGFHIPIAPHQIRPSISDNSKRATALLPNTIDVTIETSEKYPTIRNRDGFYVTPL